MRSHYCGGVTETLMGKEVSVCGWIHRRRDHGGVIFLDVRDRAGLVQVVFEPENAELFAVAETLRSEYVIQVKGLVRERPEGQANPNLPTGQIEILSQQLVILNAAETPPFPLDEHHNVGEDVRLKHRYIDLRRPEMQEKLFTRAAITRAIRDYMDAK